MTTFRSAFFCDHANECPSGTCKCPPDCACRERMCVVKGNADLDTLCARNREAVRLQPAPVKNDRRPIQDLVIEDLREGGLGNVATDQEARKAIGLRKYGTLLQAFNGRDALRDAYEEALDQLNYLRQAVEEARDNASIDLLQTYDDAINQVGSIRNLIDQRLPEDEHRG